MRLSKKFRRGFTLIEVLVVIAILAILGIIAFVVFQNVQKYARDSRRIADMKAIQRSMEVYYDNNGNYSTNGSIYDAGFLDPYFSSGKTPHDPSPNGGTGLPGDYQNHVCPNQYRVCQALEVSRGNAGGNTAICTDSIPPGTGYYCVRNLRGL